jgi:hypothetical protein
MLGIKFGRLKVSVRSPVIILRYHPVNKPIPRGWELANDFRRYHHGIYSILIRRKRRDFFYVVWH